MTARQRLNENAKNTQYTGADHTFVICAYGESKYLPQCIDSLIAQQAKSNIIISTATPNGHIRSTASEYGIELRVNTRPPGIAGDWNFAYKQAGTRLITLAHQDDIYLPDYLSTALAMLSKAAEPIIFFSHYAEITENASAGQGFDIHFKTLRLNVKRLMLWPLRLFKRSRFIRRRILSMGSAICCPSVTFADLENIEFTDTLKCNLDWHKWEELSKLRGSFVYCNRPLLYHRLHKGAETSKFITDGTRREEDYIMFQKFWPAPVAKIISGVYTKSEDANGA